MKIFSKTGLIIFVISLSLLLSGCGDKKYTCTKVEKSDNMETTSKIEVKKDGVSTSVTMVISYDTEKEAKDAEANLKEINLYSSVKRDGKKVIAEYSKFIEGKANDEEREDLEKDGYTCK